MDNDLNYEPYLLISSKKFVISVTTDLNEKVYHDEIFTGDNFDQINFEKLNFFLNENIFKIEKKLKKFVKKLSIILDMDLFFPIELSIKKKNYDNLVDLKNINYLLYEAKDSCQKTIDDKKIIHMLISNYRINNQDYALFPGNIKCDTFSLDIKFICINVHLIKNFEKTFKKYHISLSQVLSANYVKSFLSNKENDIFSMAKKIKNGYNANEIKIVNKSPKNKGFFEKFFNLFS